MGIMHHDKIDEFMEKYFGGRWIEVNFVTLMLQRTIFDLTEEFCEQCGKCISGCPISHVIPDFSPSQIISKVRSGQTKDLLKSDIIWNCTSCLMCEEQCPGEMSPYEVIETLRKLSVSTGYHFPRCYSDINKKILRLGIIQEPKVVLGKMGGQHNRKDLDLPSIMVPSDMEKFAEALQKLSNFRVVL